MNLLGFLACGIAGAVVLGGCGGASAPRGDDVSDGGTPQVLATPVPTQERSSLQETEQVDRNAIRGRIAAANAAFEELLINAPDEPRRLVVSLEEPLAAVDLLTLGRARLVDVEKVFTWNMPPDGPNAITGSTGLHLPEGELLTFRMLRDSLVRFLDSGLRHMNGQDSREQRRSHTQLRERLMKDRRALTLNGWSCTCSAANVVALAEDLGVEVNAVEQTDDPVAMPIWFGW